jgi:hypothetical protein
MVVIATDNQASSFGMKPTIIKQTAEPNSATVLQTRILLFSDMHLNFIDFWG